MRIFSTRDHDYKKHYKKALSLIASLQPLIRQGSDKINTYYGATDEIVSNEIKLNITVLKSQVIAKQQELVALTQSLKTYGTGKFLSPTVEKPTLADILLQIENVNKICSTFIDQATAIDDYINYISTVADFRNLIPQLSEFETSDATEKAAIVHETQRYYGLFLHIAEQVYVNFAIPQANKNHMVSEINTLKKRIEIFFHQSDVQPFLQAPDIKTYLESIDAIGLYPIKKAILDWITRTNFSMESNSFGTCPINLVDFNKDSNIDLLLARDSNDVNKYVIQIYSAGSFAQLREATENRVYDLPDSLTRAIIVAVETDSILNLKTKLEELQISIDEKLNPYAQLRR